MSEPTEFASTSPNYGLPFLFSGQSQKELFVNQAHLLIDSLVHTSVKGKSANVPETPGQGDT